MQTAVIYSPLRCDFFHHQLCQCFILVSGGRLTEIFAGDFLNFFNESLSEGFLCLYFMLCIFICNCHFIDFLSELITNFFVLFPS